jgi:hypothetical protein
MSALDCLPGKAKVPYENARPAQQESQPMAAAVRSPFFAIALSRVLTRTPPKSVILAIIKQKLEKYMKLQ